MTSKRMSQLLWAALLAIVIASDANAIQTPLTLAQVTQRAEHIVVGKVVAMRTYEGVWEGTGTILFTDVTIQVSDEWKGKVSDHRIVLQVPGGVRPDGSGMRASGAPVFHMNEKVLVFCRTYNKHMWVYGHSQGKYTINLSRVIGRDKNPVDKDILLHPLKRRVTNLLPKETK